MNSLSKTVLAGSLVAAVAAVPASAVAPQTIALTSITLKHVVPDKTSFISTSVDKSGGKVVGYDVATGSFNAKTHKARITDALALAGGVITSTYVIKSDPNDLHGKIIGGTGAYKDATGTIRVQAINDKKSTVTVTLK
jgi:hypothetical protein